MALELFLTKIAVSVLRRTASPALAALLKTALDLQSVFEVIDKAASCVGSRSSCGRLGVVGLYAASDRLIDRSVDRLLAIGRSAIHLEMTDSGVYVASDVAPTFKAPRAYGDLSAYFALLDLPKAPETDNDIIGPATYHDVRGHFLLKRGRYTDGIKHRLHGHSHKWIRLEEIGDLQKGRALYADALRYYMAAVQDHGFGTAGTSAYSLNGKIAGCYEALGRFEDALEVYFASWAPIGHYGVIYKQFQAYKAANPSLQLSDDRLIELVQHMRYIAKHGHPAPFFINGDDVPRIEREIASIEHELSGRGIVCPQLGA